MRRIVGQEGRAGILVDDPLDIDELDDAHDALGGHVDIGSGIRTNDHDDTGINTNNDDDRGTAAAAAAE